MSDEINLLQPDSVIAEIRSKFTYDIDFLERKYKLPPYSLLIQLGLHIYKYTREELFLCSHFDETKIKQYSINRNLIFDELFSLINYLKQDLTIYNELREGCLQMDQDTKVVSIDRQYEEVGVDGARRKIIFDEVPSYIGKHIQEDIHYIRCGRQDTHYELGLFASGAKVPFAYAAFSQLDRHYLLNLPLFKTVPKDKIFVLTRAYSFPNSPRNAMSSLYSQCFSYLKKEAGAAYVVTALNQNLFFSGASLRGANMNLITTSPMKYYYLNGRYSTRRKLERSDKPFDVQKQKFKATPIMWFGKSLLPAKRIPRVELTAVSEEMYDSR